VTHSGLNVPIPKSSSLVGSGRALGTVLNEIALKKIVDIIIEKILIIIALVFYNEIDIQK